jgi:3-oxoacyl-[acyl-carrier-protein] synthase-3
LEYLGNTGSAALPTAAGIGTETGFVPDGSRVALLGIGSGINVVMLGLEWNKTLATSNPTDKTIENIVQQNTSGKASC